MKLGISEILDKVENAYTKQEKMDILKKNESNVLISILALNFDHTVKWKLPPGPTPYKPSDQLDLHGQLYMEHRRLYLFMDSKENRLGEETVQRLWIQLLESLDKRDAIVMDATKNHDLTCVYKTVTKELVKDTFDLNFPEGEKKEESTTKEQPKSVPKIVAKNSKSSKTGKTTKTKKTVNTKKGKRG